MANDLLIKINADAKNATKAFDDIRAQSEDLENTLNKVATISGIAFAAFTAEIFFSVKAFEEAQTAAVGLTNALQNQGIYSKALQTEYGNFADEVQRKTGIDNDAVIAAQAVAQTYLGQTKITQGLTTAIADLGASMGGDLNGAAEKIARTIGTSTNAFARQGLILSETATKAERFAKVMEFVQTKAGGLAEEFNKANGYSQALSTAFGNLQEGIGERFAPAIASARQAFAAIFTYLSNSPVILDLAVAFIAAGTAITGIVAAAAVAVPAFLAMQAAATAFGLTLNIALAGIPLAIGAAIAVITLLALNWDKSLAFIKGLSTSFVTFISEAFSGLGQVLIGALEFNPKMFQAGLEQLKGSFAKAKAEGVKTYEEIRATQVEAEILQKEDAKKAADEKEAKEQAHQARLREIQKTSIELLKLQNANASAAAIELKSKELEVLKALDQEKSATELRLLTERRDQIRALEDEQNAEDLERMLAFEQIKADTRAEILATQDQLGAEIRDTKRAELEATAMIENDIDRKLQEEILARRIASRNQELKDRKKYGEAVAVINKVLTSEEVRGVKTATDDLVALQNSKSKELKAIGKVAAVASITISTAESAMNIFRGFSTIPIVGPALGIAGAAAAVAFGGERIQQVTAAASGGLIEGGVTGKDSVPAMLMPGELVVPKKNFKDVVGAVQGTTTQNNGEMTELLRTIAEKPTGNSTTINGDILAEDSYVDKLLGKLNDTLEFRNGRLYGVTA